MRVYKDKLEVERLNEIVERIKEFSFILDISVDSDEHGKNSSRIGIYERHSCFR